MTTTEIKLFVQLWDRPGAKLTPTVARYLLRLGFTDEDAARMHELLARNRAGTIKPTEAAELDDYSTVGNLLGILQSKARRALKPVRATRNGHARRAR
jgi:hypothetical protein